MALYSPLLCPDLKQRERQAEFSKVSKGFPCLVFTCVNCKPAPSSPYAALKYPCVDECPKVTK